MTLRFARSILLALPLALAVPALAQDMATALPNHYALSDILDAGRVDAILRAGRGAGQLAEPATGKKTKVHVVTTYHPSRKVSARVRRLYAEWMSSLANARSGRRIAATMAERDPVRSWAKIAGADGLHPGDMADAIAGYWVLNWTMANGAGASRAETRAVRRQVRRMLVSNPGGARFSGAERQEISEVLMLNYLIDNAAYTDAKARGDTATLDRLGEEAEARFRKGLGVDLKGLRLTGAGFVSD